MPVDVELKKLEKYKDSTEIGMWLDENMPNPPLPDPQRWSIGYSQDGRCGIRFESEDDATIFMLMWG